MLHSMTGFGSAVYKEENVSVSVELKAVNNRFFKLSLRITDGYTAMEQPIESLVRSVVGRGAINANVRISVIRETSGYQINSAILQSYAKQLTDAAAMLGRADYAVLLERLVTLPGVIVMEHEDNEGETEKIWMVLEKALSEALNALQTMRKAEGDAMEKDLAANVELLRQSIGRISVLAPRAAPTYRQKLKERIEKAMEEQPEHYRSPLVGDPDFVRELAIYADRCDISEELVRFQSHLEQFRAGLQSRESCGRKLDFLTQELFREVNTIGSKANDADITKHVVEVKTTIERMREMVQNVE